MAIHTNYCRCWYIILAACVVAYAQAADVTWLQWTVQPASYIGISHETSRVPHSDVAAMCVSEGGAILDPVVVDVTSQEFATLIEECFKIDIQNFNFWVDGPEDEGYCSGIVLQNSLFVADLFECTTKTRYICYSTVDETIVVCVNGTTTDESSTPETITGESSTPETITGESSTPETITGESSTAETITGQATIITTTGADTDGTGAGVAVYAGAAAGGVVVLVVVIVVAVCCARKTRHRSPKGHVYINAGSVTNTHTTTVKPRSSSLNSAGTEAVPPSNSNVNVNPGGEQELELGRPQEDNPDYTALSSSSREPLPQETPYEGITGTFDPELHDQVRGGGVPYAEFTIQSADGSQRGDDTPYEDVTGLSL